jgi:putative ABC transporter, ATP-binding protein
MKISKLKIVSLHGCFDYDIDFNEDITFFYGENGCGKTTILNILDNILAGEIFKLFKYKFENIQLEYYALEDDKERVDKKIEISSSADELRELYISFEGKDEIVPSNWKELHGAINRNSYKIKDIYFRNFRVSGEIRNKFNYILLPWNRINIDEQNASNYRVIKSSHLYSNEELSNNSSMNKIEELIFRYVSMVNAQINSSNREFRDMILNSSLEINDDVKNLYTFNEFNPSNLESELNNISENYLKLLKTLNIKQEEEEQTRIKSYFESLIQLAKGKSKTEGQLPLQLFIQYTYLNRIKEIIKIFETNDNENQKIKININKFLEVVNFFLSQGKDKKEIVINQFGEVYFKSNFSNGKLNLEYLSSGEKQIVTLFANLLFQRKSNNLSFFIVDEPELSLHLRWQKTFVEVLHKMSKDTQLIFATHSPEIIGLYRDKVKKLEKKYRVKKYREHVIDNKHIENNVWN